MSVCGWPLLDSRLSRLHPAHSHVFLLKDKFILFQNWLDPSKEIKKQIRSECLLVVGVRMGGQGLAPVLPPAL